MAPEINVHLWSGLRTLADGKEIVTLRAGTIGQMLAELARLHPALEDYLEDNVSVSVDGKLIATDLTHALFEHSEIYLLQRLRGG